MEFTNVAASVVSDWLGEYSTSQNNKQSVNPGPSQNNRFQSRPFRCGIGAEHLAESKANEQNYRIDVSLHKNLRKSNTRKLNMIQTSHTRRSSELSLSKNTKDDQSSGDEEDSKVKAIKTAKELSPRAKLFLATQKKRKRNRRKKKKLNS